MMTMSKKKVAKKKRRGDVISFKIPLSISDMELELINQLHLNKRIAAVFFEKIRELLNQKHQIVLPIDHPLSDQERENLDNPAVRKMLANICLALLREKVPPLSIGLKKEEEGSKQEIEPVEEEKEDDWINNADCSELVDKAFDSFDDLF
jgi:hypothetical protein